MQILYGSYGWPRGVCIVKPASFPCSWGVSLLSCNYMRALNRLVHTDTEHSWVHMIFSVTRASQLRFSNIICVEVLGFQGLTELKPHKDNQKNSIFVIWGSIFAYLATENSFYFLYSANLLYFERRCISVLYLFTRPLPCKKVQPFGALGLCHRVMDRGNG